ncbi:hypothetical protein WMF27_11505 [Sorangium sp. So ce281]
MCPARFNVVGTSRPEGGGAASLRRALEGASGTAQPAIEPIFAASHYRGP